MEIGALNVFLKIQWYYFKDEMKNSLITNMALQHSGYNKWNTLPF